MNAFFSVNPKIKTVVIITPRDPNTRVSNPDTHFGKIGRRLMTHIRRELALSSTDLFPTGRFCILDGCPKSCLTYKDTLSQLQGSTPLKSIDFDTRNLLEIRSGIASKLCNSESDTVFIITSKPFAFLIAVEEDTPTTNIPENLPPLSAFVVVNRSGKGVFKEMFIPTTVTSS